MNSVPASAFPQDSIPWTATDVWPPILHCRSSRCKFLSQVGLVRRRKPSLPVRWEKAGWHLRTLRPGRTRCVNRHAILTPYRGLILTPLALSWPGAAQPSFNAAEPGQRCCISALRPVFEAPAFVAGLDYLAVMREAVERSGKNALNPTGVGQECSILPKPWAIRDGAFLPPHFQSEGQRHKDSRKSGPSQRDPSVSQ